jgi:hypothetical protein
VKIIFILFQISHKHPFRQYIMEMNRIKLPLKRNNQSDQTLTFWLFNLKIRNLFQIIVYGKGICK